MKYPDHNLSIAVKTEETFHRLASDPVLGTFVDISLPIPKIFRGSGPIRLVILGQDPTVKNEKARKSITTVLNLDKSGSLRTYLLMVCGYLGIDLDREVYATNFYKNFFKHQPTQIKEVNIFQTCLPYWLPVLHAELAQFPGVPVLDSRRAFVGNFSVRRRKQKVRDYWGYTSSWKQGIEKGFSALPAAQNILGRLVFPYPHQPSWHRKKFYSDRLEKYCCFTKSYR